MSVSRTRHRYAALLVVLAVLGTPPTAQTQETRKLPRIGFLAAATEARRATDMGFYNTFRQGLRELGYVELRGLRGAAGRARRRARAAEGRRGGDPVIAGFVASLGRPGGNMTGVTFLSYELAAKRLELLKEVAPAVSRVAVLADPAHPGEERELQETQGSARSLQLTLDHHRVRPSTDVSHVFDAIVTANADGILVFPDRTTFTRRDEIAEFAARRRLPSAFGSREYVEAGGLISYGPNRDEAYRRLAAYVDKILKGAKPSDLPVEQPTKLELAINLKTAKTLGLGVPPSILLRAQHVIE